jgi:hypothetical protein
MSIVRKFLPGIVVGLAVAAAASPGFAQWGEDGMSAARARALRECNDMASKFTQHTWGDTQIVSLLHDAARPARVSIENSDPTPVFGVWLFIDGQETSRQPDGGTSNTTSRVRVVAACAIMTPHVTRLRRRDDTVGFPHLRSNHVKAALHVVRVAMRPAVPTSRVVGREAVGGHRRRHVMTVMTRVLAAAALSVAMAAAASPSFAQRAEDGMSGGRTKALRDCNATAGKFTQYTWGATQLDQYRACMSQHGEQE